MSARLLAPEPDPAVGPPSAVAAAPLPPGTPLRDFTIEGLLGQGGFGVVYRARQRSSGRAVAIKEYLPAQLAVRRVDGGLAAAADVHAATYAAGLRGFVDEVRLLARVRHPALVEVLDAWEQQGTAYLAMPLYEGPTLERLIEAHPDGLDAGTLRAVAGPLLGALDALHAAGCVHRDVAPDNVIVRPDAGAVLLDLGAARRVIGDRVRAMTVMLKAGYAPIEQYADDPDCRIGPWSDVYALGAVLHHAATGEPPPPSPLRVMRDTRVPLAGRPLPGCDAGFVAAVDAAMALRPEDRPQNARAMRALLGLEDEPPGTASIAPVPPAPVPPGHRQPARRGARGLVLAAAAAFAVSVVVWVGRDPGPAPEVAEPVVADDGRSGDAIRTERAARAAPQAAAAQRMPPPPAAPPVATLRLSVSPWAEVWVDGVRRGVTPPLKTLTLAPGRRRVELRNPAAPPVVIQVDARAGRTTEVEHRFAPGGAR